MRKITHKFVDNEQKNVLCGVKYGRWYSASSEDKSVTCKKCNLILTKKTDMKKEMEHSEIAKAVWSKLNYTPCVINGKDTTIMEIKEVWELIKELEKIVEKKQNEINYHLKANIDLLLDNEKLITVNNDLREFISKHSGTA